MRTVSKSLITLSMCLGLSGAVYAQSTPSAVKPSTTETAKKPAAVSGTNGANVSKNGPTAVKEKPAAISGTSATPAVKAPKHEHAARVSPKPAVEKANKTESPDAKKLENTQAKEAKSNVAKPESVKKQPELGNKPEHAAASNVHKSMKHEGSKPSEKPATDAAAKPMK
jgi:hypothetical protein